MDGLGVGKWRSQLLRWTLPFALRSPLLLNEDVLSHGRREIINESICFFYKRILYISTRGDLYEKVLNQIYVVNDNRKLFHSLFGTSLATSIFFK